MLIFLQEIPLVLNGTQLGGGGLGEGRERKRKEEQEPT